MKPEEIRSNTYFSTSMKEDMTSHYDHILSYPPEKHNSKWSVSWSDLMMTMFILFAVLYVYQTGNRDLLFGKGPGKNFLAETGEQSIVDLGVKQKSSEIFDQARQAISEVMLTQKNSLELMGDSAVRIVLAGDLLFDPGQVNLKIGARYQLNQIARVLKENTLTINVVGHTDDAPTRSESYPTNWELSAMRAVQVARYLTEVTGIDEKRVFVSAQSYHQPVRSNDTGRNRALNRRVEIILVKEKPYVSSNP